MKQPIQTLPDQSARRSRRLPLVAGTGTVCAAAFLFLASQSPAQAQGIVNDNFDSYSTAADLTANGWINTELALFYGLPAAGTTALVPVGAGKGVRIQASAPYLPDIPANNYWYKTNDYTDFYEAVDLINWQGTSLDQACVLFARVTDTGTLNVETNQNPAVAQGVILNYDCTQDGQTASDRRAGQLQINDITAGFNATTLAAADVTLVVGHSYRFVFTGVGQHYTGKVYDLNDLTAPLIIIQCDDASASFTHGSSGLLSFNRSNDGPEDVGDATYDNYYSGPSDPNLATPPAINYPIADTPAVTVRYPTNRWQNFLDNHGADLSFTASTFSGNAINAAATKFRLNGVDVSAALVLPANGPSITVSYPAAALDTNQLYSAQIEVTDVAGTKSSTNTFWFDTFSDAYLLTSAVKTIEAEDYNHDTGEHIAEPIPASGTNTTTGADVNIFPTGYYYAFGTVDVDYHTGNGVNAKFDLLRPQDPVLTTYGLIGISYQDAVLGDVNANENDPGSDHIRSQYATLNLYEGTVNWSKAGDWQNYTRSFGGAFYRAYLRYSSLGATTNELHLVTSDPTQPDQTTAKLGTFNIPNNARWANYLYTPLVSDIGALTLLHLSGVNTLRLAAAGVTPADDRHVLANYILMVQTPITVLACDTVNGTYTPVTGATSDYVNGTISVPVPAGATFYRLSAAIPVTIQSISVSGGNVILTL